MEIVHKAKLSPRILIADDHRVFAECFRIYLEAHYPVVGIVEDGRAMVDEASRLKPEVIVVDVGMPRLNGLDAARSVKKLMPDVKFVFLTMQDDPNLAAAALELGPIGFVLKHSGGQEILEAIGRVKNGKTYVTPKLRTSNWVDAKVWARQFSKELTPRQRDIVQMWAEGRSIKEIAGILNLSDKTVEFHKHHIMESFHLRSNAALVLFAVQRKLIAVHPAVTRTGT